jgi:hypothetical protein
VKSAPGDTLTISYLHSIVVDGKSYRDIASAAGVVRSTVERRIKGLLRRMLLAGHLKDIEAGGLDRLESIRAHGELILAATRLRTDSLSVVHEAARSGLGVAALSRWQCIDDVRAGHLVVVAPGWAPPSIVLHAVYPSRRALSRSGTRFLDELTDAFAAVERSLSEAADDPAPCGSRRLQRSEMPSSLTNGA